MEYIRVSSIHDELFDKMFALLQTVFPEDEVLEKALWEEPLKEQYLRVYVAVHDGEVVGTTEYRILPDLKVAMTDFTIVGREGLGVGRFLMVNREKDLRAMAQEAGVEIRGMFAEIYDPYRAEDHGFGGIKPMDPFVRREVLSHIGFRKLDFTYVHPSWQNNGEAVSLLDFCFLSWAHEGDSLEASLVVDFLTTYYSVLPNKSADWHGMIDELKKREQLALLPI